ncbi:TPA: hypothetical protein ACFO85_000704, partial [Neisseria meningitidis]
MSKFVMVVQAVYEGLERHEMVFLRDELERRIGALKADAMPSETREWDKPAPAVLSVAGADAGKSAGVRRVMTGRLCVRARRFRCLSRRCIRL